MSQYSIADASTIDVAWQKASASGGDGNCVELAPYDGLIAVRDSKSPHGPAILYPHPALTTLLTALKTGTL
ncbi:DUF397 domain-containing protein [Streptomyces sp. NPDC004539]|uniref:DUF397 domain-containing protein n=1 Tax=Streptomyces sp. NPDC004539 TaxID=3154280 RepID=UPI0033BCE675